MRARRGLGIAAVGVVALLCTALPAPAAAPPARATRQALVDAFLARGDAVTSVLQAASLPLRRHPALRDRDIDAWRAERDAVTPPRQLGLALQAEDLSFAQPAPAPGQPVTAPPPIYFPFTFGTAVNAGDLDADGLDDVVVVGAGALDSDVRARALRGTDGSELWSVGLDEGAFPTLTPLDPAGGDVLDQSYVSGESSGSGECTDQGCEDSYTSTFTWVLGVRSASAGALRWSREYAGRSSYRYVDQGDETSHTFELTDESVNGGLLALPGPDLDGDGAPDVLVSRGRTVHTFRDESTGVLAAQNSTTTETLRSDIVVEVLSGITGEVLYEDTLEDVAATGTLTGAGETTGDGTGDLLIALRNRPDYSRTCTAVLVEVTCEEQGDPASLALTVIDGDGFETAWSTTVAAGDGGAVQGSRADLDGDAASDLLVSTVTATDEGVTGALRLLSGADGTEQWIHERDGVVGPVAITPLEGDGGIDLVTATVTGGILAADGGAPEVAFDRLDGASGALLHSTRVTAPEGYDPENDFALAGALSAGDGDGDGSDDPAALFLILKGETGEVESSVTVESARTGTTLFRRDEPDTLGFQGAGDLDGDGRADAVVAETFFFSPPDDADAPQLRALRLADGSVLWQRNVSSGVLRVQRGGDEDGDAAEELLVETWEPSTATGVALASVNGQDGVDRWTFPPLPQVAVGRVAGPDRIRTAIAASTAVFDSAVTVVLARADAYPDALAGGPVAAILDAPLLLTDASGLHADVAFELDRLGVTHAVLLGGTAALAPQVEADLAARGITSERIAGADRYDTAALIADRVIAAGGDERAVLLVQGADADPARGWPDAVSASAHGAAFGQPVLLTETGSLPPPTAAALDRHQPAYALVVGGAVSDAVASEVQAHGTGVIRIAGSNRFATSRLLAENGVLIGADPAHVWIATGRTFPDALAAGAAVGATRGVLLLVDGPGPEGAAEALTFLAAQRYQLEHVHLLGGEQAVSEQVADAIRAALR